MVIEANRQLAREELSGEEVIREPLRLLSKVKRIDLIRHLESNGCQFLREGAATQST